MIDGPPSDQGKRTNLGRGLAALFGEENEDYASLDKVRSSKTVPIEHLRPGRFQPRHHFDEAAVDALAESIKAQGILQPILVRRHPDRPNRSEEHTSELQSLMRTSYAVFCLKKKKTKNQQ